MELIKASINEMTATFSMEMDAQTHAKLRLVMSEKMVFAEKLLLLQGEYLMYLQVYDPGNTTRNAKNITEFKLRIFNIKTHLYGDNRETIRIVIKDTSLVEDLNGNILSQNSFVGSLNKFEYISEDTLRNVDTMGGSVEISIILVFVVNLLFQLSMSSSDSFMWSLIHSLQIIRYIFLVNVKVPQILEVFMKYLAVTIGEVDKIYGFIPNWFSTYLVDTSELNEGVIVGEKFAENGYISPF